MQLEFDESQRTERRRGKSMAAPLFFHWPHRRLPVPDGSFISCVLETREQDHGEACRKITAASIPRSFSDCRRHSRQTL